MKLFSCINILFLVSLALVSQPLIAQQLSIMGTMKLAPGSRIGVFGDIYNNGTLIDSSAEFVWAGDGPQTILGGSVTEVINLTVNNTSTEGVILNQELQVSGTLTLSRGVIHTSDAALLVLKNQAVLIGGGASSHVNGPMTKIGNDAFSFPVGKAGLYAPVSIGAPSSATDAFTCEYFNDNPNALYDVTSKDASITSISSCEYWVVARTVGTAAVDVTLNWDSRSCTVEDPVYTKVVRWDGNRWKDHGNGGSTGTSESGSVTSSGTINNFSPFTIGSSATALPIGLLRFDDHCINGSRIIEWATATEVDNDYFTVETSDNGTDWMELAEIEGQGRSTTALTYQYTVPYDRHTGDYFRLKQTDSDGQFSWSELIFATPCIEGSPTLSIYPTPTSGLLHVELSTGSEENILFTIYSLDGALMSNGALKGGVVDLSGIPPGYYLCRFQTPEMVFIKQVILSN